MMKWFRKKQVKEMPTEKVESTPKKPKYYSVTIKEKPEFIPNFTFTPGGRAGFYAIRANIIDRDSGKIVDVASGYFDTMEQIDEGLKKLQDDIHEKIKDLYAIDAFIARLYQVDIVNNGLEWFIS